ncbi:MAG: transporter substrate-binding domain-containing protein, partial [Aeromonadaceae bacterium]
TWGLKQHHMEHNLKEAPMTIYSAPAFFMFSKRSVSPEFVDRFNQALRQMKKSGEYQKILDRYTRLN